MNVLIMVFIILTLCDCSTLFFVKQYAHFYPHCIPKSTAHLYLLEITKILNKLAIENAKSTKESECEELAQGLAIP